MIRITNVQKGLIVDNDPQFYPINLSPEFEKYMLQEDDLLLSLTGNVGRVGLLHRDMLPAALNQRVACLRVKNDRIILSYLFAALNSDRFERDCILSAKGIAQLNMSTEWLKKYTIPLPPLALQREFAAFIAQQEKAKSSLKESLAALTAAQKALMNGVIKANHA